MSEAREGNELAFHEDRRFLGSALRWRAPSSNRKDDDMMAQEIVEGPAAVLCIEFVAAVTGMGRDLRQRSRETQADFVRARCRPSNGRNRSASTRLRGHSAASPAPL